MAGPSSAPTGSARRSFSGTGGRGEAYAGTPEGLPETLSWHAIVHNLTFVFAFLGLIIAIFVIARRYVTEKKWGFATFCIATGLATPALIVVSQMRPDVAGYILFGMNVLVNVWIVLLALRLLAEHRASRAPS